MNIVERLRYEEPTGKLCLDAIDEIERLRAEGGAQRAILRRAMTYVASPTLENYQRLASGLADFALLELEKEQAAA